MRSLKSLSFIVIGVLVIGGLSFLSNCSIPFNYITDTNSTTVDIPALTNTIYVEAGQTLDISDEDLSRIEIDEITFHFKLKNNISNQSIIASSAWSAQGEAASGDYKIYYDTPPYLTPENENQVYIWFYQNVEIPAGGSTNVDTVIYGDNKVLQTILTNKSYWIVVKNDPGGTGFTLQYRDALEITVYIDIKGKARIIP